MTASHYRNSIVGARPAWRYGWSLVEAIALTLALGAVLFLIDSETLKILSASGLAGTYAIGASVLASRQSSPNLPQKHRIAAFALVQLVGGGVATAGLSILVSASWFHMAYRREVVDPDGMGIGFPLELATMAPVAVALIGGAAFMFLVSVVLLRRDDEEALAFFRRVRTDGITVLWPAAAAWLVLGFALLSLANVVVSSVSLLDLLQSVNPARIVDTWFVASEFPFFPVALFASALLFTAFRRLQPAALTSLRALRRPPSVGPPGMIAFLASVGAGYGWFLYLLHVGIVAGLGTVAMIVSWGEISRATDNWIGAQQAAGRTAGEIAADLHGDRGGTTGQSRAGLPSFLAGLDETFEDAGLGHNCTITIDAVVADNSSLRNDPWIAGYEAGFRPLPPVGYCLRLACPSPVVWHDQPVVILHSSHPSRNRSWAYNVFMDLFGAGAAPEPGGYCTKTGELAAEYQG